MAFRVEDYQDLIRMLSERPEWREELRRQLLSDDFLALPGLVRDLVQAQERTEERLEALAEAQQRTEQAVAALVEAQKQTEQALKGVVDRYGKMNGELLEMRYARRSTAYFGRLLRRVRTILPGHLDGPLEDALEAHLTVDELTDLLLLDVLAVGRLRRPTAAEAQEVWLAVEVSSVIDREDVERAQRRAALLQKAGYRVVPVVAGEGLTQGATELLQDVPVVLMLDGRVQGWEEALAV